MLAADELGGFWELAIPVEAVYVDDVELERALSEHRVLSAISYSSMGTADTYWALARSTDDLARVREKSMVEPPGVQAEETPFEDHRDDRDVDRVLWDPFRAHQRAAFLRQVRPEDHDALVAAFARIVADVEERWARGSKLADRAPFIAWLRHEGPVDAEALAAWLADHKRASVRHLVRAIRARWITRDVEQAYRAVIASAERFSDSSVRREIRMDLLRAGVRILRARPKLPIAACPTCTTFEQRVELDYERQAVRPPALADLRVVASTSSEDGSASLEIATLQCSRCGTCYASRRAKDEGHRFMDPTEDSEHVTRLSVYEALDTLGLSGGDAPRVAREDIARRLPTTLESLTAQLDAAPTTWHLQQYAIECAAQARLISRAFDALADVLLHHSNAVVRVQMLRHVVERASYAPEAPASHPFRVQIHAGARAFLAAHPVSPVVDSVLREQPGASFHFDLGQYFAIDTHAVAAATVFTAVHHGFPIDDRTVDLLVALLDGTIAQRHHAAWALSSILQQTPERVATVRARIEASPPPTANEGAVRMLRDAIVQRS